MVKLIMVKLIIAKFIMVKVLMVKLTITKLTLYGKCVVTIPKLISHWQKICTKRKKHCT
jgi:hypothetical protein